MAMESVLAIVWGVLSVGLLLLMQSCEVSRLRAEVRAERARADEATNRLLAAWKDGYSIPEPEEEHVEEEPLPPALREWVAQWEGADAQAKWDADVRRKLALGRTPDQILMDLEVAS